MDYSQFPPPLHCTHQYCPKIWRIWGGGGGFGLGKVVHHACILYNALLLPAISCPIAGEPDYRGGGGGGGGGGGSQGVHVHVNQQWASSDCSPDLAYQLQRKVLASKHLRNASRCSWCVYKRACVHARMRECGCC